MEAKSCSILQESSATYVFIYQTNKLIPHNSIIITPNSNSTVRGYQSNNITIRLQGLLGNVTNITAPTTCSGTGITWDPPPTLAGVPITLFVLELGGEKYNSIILLIHPPFSG